MVRLSQEEVFHTTSLFTTEDDQIKYGSRMLKTVKAMEAAKLDWNRVHIELEDDNGDKQVQQGGQIIENAN